MSSSSSSNTAPIKWAQRSDSLYLTIALPDVKDETIKLSDGALAFSGESNGKSYNVDIAFWKEVDAEGSTYKVLPRSIQMHIMKKAKKEGDDEEGDDEAFWPRLLKDKALEKNQVKIDWDRYVDEDEEEEGFDTSALAGGQGMGGMGGGGMPPGMMGGMGGMDGGMPGGMDMEALMKQMGGMGGMMGGAGGGDMGGLGDLGAMAGMPDGGDDDDDDDDDDDLPELEEAA